MDIDWNIVRARFSEMTREELLEEAALRTEEYAPPAQRILADAALERGISAAEIDRRRQAASSADGATNGADGIDVPALITSSDDKNCLLELVKVLRARSIPAVVRELDPKAFHASGHRVGRWGLMVSGTQAAEAARLLEPVAPPSLDEHAPPGCGGGCSSCSPGDESAGEEWPEDGDWWRTPAGEADPDAEQSQ